MLDTQYFHVVFTLPEAIAAIAYQNKALVYGLLFRATAETLRTVAEGSKVATATVERMAKLWQVEETIRSQCPEARVAVRQQTSAALVSELF